MFEGIWAQSPCNLKSSGNFEPEGSGLGCRV